MPAVYQTPSQRLWLALFMATLLCCSVSGWAESQQSTTELIAATLDTSDDDRISVREHGAPAFGMQLIQLAIAAPRQLPVAISDAYPSLILHGPPATHHPA